MTFPDPLPPAPPLPPRTGEPGVTAAWEAHLGAGRIGVREAEPQGANFRCAGLATAMGWASPAGRFVHAGESRSGGDVPSSSSTSAG